MLEKLIDAAAVTVEAPTASSPIFIWGVVATVSLCFFLCLFFRNASPGTFRLIIGFIFILMLAMEIFKQVIFPMSIVDGEIVYNYDWKAFPFQLCSTPLYVLPLVAFLPDCRLRDCAAVYIMSYALFGGIAVYAVPRTILHTRKLANLHSMAHHGLQIAVGVYTAAYYRKRKCTRAFCGAICMFAFFIAIAYLLNTAGYDHLVSLGLIQEGATFNMFYISPRADQTIPVRNDYLKALPPVIYIMAYFIVLTCIAAIILIVASIGKHRSIKRSAVEE